MTDEPKDTTQDEKAKAAPAGAEDEALRARVDAFMEVFSERLVMGQTRLVKEHNLLVDLVAGGLQTLRHNIEAPEVLEVSWDSPWVEARYTVEWDWEKGGLRFPVPKMPEAVIASLHKGDADPRELVNADGVAEAAAGLILEAAHPLALQVLTHQVAVHVKGGEEVGCFFLDPKIKDELDALPTEKERTARMEKLLEPWGFGAFEAMGDDTKSPRKFASVARAKMKDLPRLTFTGEVQGVPYEGSVVILFHPLVVDEDRREAYFPIVTGLVFGLIEPVPEKWSDISEWAKADLALGPEAWSEADRAKLWDLLLVDLVEKLREELRETKEKPKDEPTEPEEATEGTETAAASLTVVPSSAGAPAPERRYILDLPTRFDHQAAVLVRHARGLHFPRKWKDAKKWDELVKEEVVRLQDTLGEDAFKDLRAETKDKNAHGPLLKKTLDEEGEETVTLTKEAENSLLESVGHKGFRKVIKDPDGGRREYLVKRFRAAGGYIETRLSWYGSAWPFVDEGRDQLKTELEAIKEKAHQGLLFDKLDSKVQKELDGRLRLMESVRDARKVMNVILSTFGAVAQNPLRVPMWELRSFLECEKDRNGFARVMGCLYALSEVRFYLKAAKIPGLSGEAFGPFLAGVKYIPGGPGGHADGVFSLSISEDFVGSLNVWETQGLKLRDPHKALLYDWGKKLTKEEKAGLHYLKGFSSAAPYFDRAKGFSDAQSSLRQWVESQITLKKDGRKRGSPSVRVHPNAADADEPRIYGHDFCPVLPKGKRFHGALTHFKEGKGEKGRTLAGSPTSPTKTSGAHKEGLLHVLGYTLPSGRAGFKRGIIARKALQDMRAVVEEAFGGVVAGLMGERWLTLKDAEGLPVDTLLKNVSWHLFLAEDWRERIPQEVEAYHEKRHARGETDYLVKVTKDQRLVELTEQSRGLPEETVGLDRESLALRLYVARNARNLSQTAVGKLFGVSRRTVDYWERGTEAGSGRGRGKPIPSYLAPLVLRWTDTGTPPEAAELASVKAGRKRRPKWGKKAARGETP